MSNQKNKNQNQKQPTHEFTLNLGDRVYLEGYGYIELLARSHYLAAQAQMARIGLGISKNINISRGELYKARRKYVKYPLLPKSLGNLQK